MTATTAQARREANWRNSLEFGRRCIKCGYDTKAWAKAGAKFCDGCVAKSKLGAVK